MNNNYLGNGIGALKALLGTYVVILAVITGHAVSTNKVNIENNNNIESDIDESNFTYTIVNCNNNSYIVSTSSYNNLEANKDKSVVVLADIDGNNIVVERNQINKIGEFQTYDEAISYLNNTTIKR